MVVDSSVEVLNISKALVVAKVVDCVYRDNLHNTSAHTHTNQPTHPQSLVRPSSGGGDQGGREGAEEGGCVRCLLAHHHGHCRRPSRSKRPQVTLITLLSSCGAVGCNLS